ncbi:protein kinase domain-containing protein [Ditylenchus destructor]|uniref:Protein kinase domain-containing protein n=1 Tax=Ditylenchus destructor TaxID=166010 RepID=A0AAD4N0T7_9BILA|nr:protein kinase domain-containing protein [Ditylenchus destructor]
MKRCKSALELPVYTKGESPNRKGRYYRGRNSLPKPSAGCSKRKKSRRERSPNHRENYHQEYLEGIEEYNISYRCLDTVPSSLPSSSSSITSNPSARARVRFCPTKSGKNQPIRDIDMFEVEKDDGEDKSANATDFLEILRQSVELARQDHATGSSQDMQHHKETYLLINNQQHKVGDVIWFHLQAFFANRSMNKRHILRSLAIQDRHILQLRAEKYSVLQDIRNFCVDDTPSPSIGPMPLSSVKALYAIYDTDYSNFLHSVMDRVKNLLERFESLTELFPTMSAMRKATLPEEMGGGPLMDVTVQLKISSLYMWYNTLQDLMRKINETGEYLGLIEGSSHRSSQHRNLLSQFLLREVNYRRRSNSNGAMHLWPFSQLTQSTSMATSTTTNRLSNRHSDSRNSIGVQSNSSFASLGSHNNSFQSVDMVDGAEGNTTTVTPTSPIMDCITAHLANTPTDSSSAISETFTELYRKVVGRSLRLRGMIEVLGRLNDICQNSLERACLSLLMPRLWAQPSWAQIVGSSEESRIVNNLKKKYGVQEHGVDVVSVCSPHFTEMNLPTFHHHFMFLTRIPVDLVIQWLDIRSQKVITTEWDMLTLNTLIEDSHDCLQAAINEKNKYIDMVNLTTPQSDEQLETSLWSFDEKLNQVFQNYLSYVRIWAQTASKPNVNCDVEWSDRVVGKISNEWMNAKKWSASVNRGEIIVARMFCNIGKDLLESMVKRYITDKFDAVELGILDVKDSAEEDFVMIEDGDNMKTSSIFVLCRAFRDMIRNLRERSLKTLSLIRLLCSELEICARYDWKSSKENEMCDEEEKKKCCDTLVEQLLKTGHIVITFSNHADCNFLVLCNKEIVNESGNSRPTHKSQSIPVSKFGQDHSAVGAQLELAKKVEDYGYLVLFPSHFLSRAPDEFKERSSLKLSFGTKTTLEHYITPNGIYLISENRFEKAVGKFLQGARTRPYKLQLIDDFCSCNDELFEEVGELKRLASDTVQEVWNYARDLGQYVLNGRRIEELDKNEYNSLKATLLQAWNAAFECHKELSRIISLSMHKDFCLSLINCISQWANFVTDTIKEKNAPPRWAMAPLDYLLSMPSNIFKPDDRLTGMKIGVEIKLLVETLNSYIDACRFKYYVSKKVSVVDRINSSIEKMERERQRKLMMSQKIGQVVETKTKHEFKTYFPSKKAPFEWQRLENRCLGSGSFGTVYLVMNMRDKCLAAMKQIHIPRENNDGLKALVDEVDILRTLDHPNLVKYYGVEVDKGELLIFMEYCSEGTLARVCREGLDPSCVRRYTHYLLQAVRYIHDHNIVHRDIKPANIFLGRKNVIKLGDFGCSFRLRDTCTRIGEINSIVGTTHYMAPEIQTTGLANNNDNTYDSSSCSNILVDQNAIPQIYDNGYGRAVDIWSTGCVVLEMLTGKKPYYYLENEFQIIWHLGNRKMPTIPSDIQRCEMSYSFLMKCLSVDPKKRPTAKELLQDPFANILPQELEQDSQDSTI